jgi:hypothetical protein
MRLTPAIAAVIIFNDNLANYLTPTDHSKLFDYSVKPCRQLWWAALLHTQVYSNTHEMVSFMVAVSRFFCFKIFFQCMHTLWYVDVDFQMTIIVAPILIYLLWRFENKAVHLIVTITLVLAAYASKIALDNGFMIREIDMYVSFETATSFSLSNLELLDQLTSTDPTTSFFISQRTFVRRRF